MFGVSVRSLTSELTTLGVVLFEISAREMPYKDFDGITAAFKVAHNQLRLYPPVSETLEVIPKLMKDCFEFKAENRPSFGIICDYLKDFQTRSR